MIKPKYSLVIIIFAVCLMSFGIWNADVPFGDEAGHISSAIRLIDEGAGTNNLYYLFYSEILKFFSQDPITAHLLCRFVTSLAASILMFIFLRSFTFISSSIPVLIAVAFWISCRLNVPLSQFGNINLFCLCLIFPSLILLVRKTTVNRALFFILSLFWASKIRPEYNAPLILFIIYLAILAALRLRNTSMSRTNPLKSISASGIILFLLLAISFMIGKGAKSNVNLDMYLRLGLDQCYTSLYSKLHPEKKISTMVEFGEITAGVFGPGGFRDACMQNPKEAVKYLALNGVINSIILVPGLIRHRSLFVPESYGKKGEIIQILLFILIFMTGTILGIKEHISKPFLKNLLRHAKYLLFKNNLIILFILASSSSAAIVLLISDPRYWISFIPLVFVWIAWSIDCIALKFQKSSFLIPIALIVIIILCHPMFLFSKSNQALIFKMRNTVAEHQVKTPVVAGLYPSSLPVFAFKNDHRTVNVDEFSTVAVAEGKYDFIAIDTYFRNSSFWAKNMGFMDGFEKNPDKYKYKLIGTTDDKHILSVYARKE